MAAVATLAHGVGVGGGYVLDDTQALLEHPVVIGDAPLWEVFTREFWGRPLDGLQWSSSYRPLTSLSFALEHRLTPEPWLHHLVNLLLYVGLCVLVTQLARRWLSAGWAMGAGLLFAVLPVHVESVASVVGRADVMAAALALVSLLLCLRTGVRRRDIAAACVAYLAALLCKEVVALLPGLAAWLLWLDRDRDPGGWRALSPAVALGVVGLSYIAIRHAVLPVALPPDFVGGDNQLRDMTGVAAFLGSLSVLGHYIELLAVPLRLCADHTYGDVALPDPGHALLGGVVLAVGLVDGARALVGRSRGLAFAAVLAYLLVGHLVIDLSVLLAERLLLWPSVWLTLAVVAGLQARLGQGLGPVAKGLAAATLLLFAGRTAVRTLDWSDGLTLYESSAKLCPAAVHGRLNLAHELRGRGRSADAVWHYGVAAAGRMAYPGPFEPAAFDVEWLVPVEERLPQLPALLGFPADRFWPSLHRFLVTTNAHAEAALVARIVSERPGKGQ